MCLALRSNLRFFYRHDIHMLLTVCGFLDAKRNPIGESQPVSFCFFHGQSVF